MSEDARRFFNKANVYTRRHRRVSSFARLNKSEPPEVGRYAAKLTDHVADIARPRDINFNGRSFRRNVRWCTVYSNVEVWMYI